MFRGNPLAERTSMTATVLVLGATGKTGRRLVPLLADRGVAVRAASRHPRADGTMFDWDRSETYGPALAGVDAVYLIPPELVEDPTDVTGPFLEAAGQAGATRLVVLSSLGAHLDGDASATGRRNLERQIMASQLEWTILRPAAFNQNFSEGLFLPGILQAGEIVSATGDGAVGFVDAEDIAAVAAAALVEDGHAGAEYVLTGPEALSFAEAAKVISEVAGRSVVHRDVPAEEMAQILHHAGVPGDYAAMLLGDMQAIREGRSAHVADSVDKVAGRPATSFVDYARRAASTWDDR